ncbi:response regulator [Dyadobacter arcticus]|uniref:DNA-binding NarL/FixJ family response regulator n=1 Tax=Dyadobacter arcticus TaxID=1078754 RepID=A0ABX0UIY8_9BACT|nr:response regulator transcription factor [Dyadobacter arcticus]NIJ52872.1 DNA-binding NarL/FixJ family response regulator [Dyadobacter arcticus]
MIRIVLFEDNKSFRQNLSLFLTGTEGVNLVGSYSDANEAVAKVLRLKPDVVLMDIQMPGISGIEAMQLLKAACPEVKVLIQTVFEDEHRVFAAICGGLRDMSSKVPIPR